MPGNRPLLYIVLLLSIAAGRDTHGILESAGKAFGIGKAYLQGDAFHRLPGLLQQRAGHLDPVIVKYGVEGLAGDLLEDLTKIALAVAAQRGHILYGKGMRVIVIDPFQNSFDQQCGKCLFGQVCIVTVYSELFENICEYFVNISLNNQAGKGGGISVIKEGFLQKLRQFPVGFLPKRKNGLRERIRGKNLKEFAQHDRPTADHQTLGIGSRVIFR